MSDMLTETPAPTEAAQVRAAQPQADQAQALDAEFEPRIRPITVLEYYKMAAIGIFGRDERLELVDGQVIVVPPMGDPHWSIVTRVRAVLDKELAEHATVVAQMPIIVAADSEPVPDVSVLRRDDAYYASGKPTVADALLLIEVADSSLSNDRTRKLRLYARARIPAYWIVDVRKGIVESYRDPAELTYREHKTYRRGDSIDILPRHTGSLTVDELLG